MKRCPFCAEEIQDAAIACRFCNRDLLPNVTRTPNQQFNPGVAAVLSFVIPGLGQMYGGRIGSGLGLFVLTIAGYAFFVVPGLILHVVGVIDAYRGGPTAAHNANTPAVVAATRVDALTAFDAQGAETTSLQTRPATRITARAALGALAVLVIIAATVAFNARKMDQRTQEEQTGVWIIRGAEQISFSNHSNTSQWRECRAKIGAGYAATDPFDLEPMTSHEILYSAFSRGGASLNSKDAADAAIEKTTLVCRDTGGHMVTVH